MRVLFDDGSVMAEEYGEGFDGSGGWLAGELDDATGELFLRWRPHGPEELAAAEAARAEALAVPLAVAELGEAVSGDAERLAALELAVAELGGLVALGGE